MDHAQRHSTTLTDGHFVIEQGAQQTEVAKGKRFFFQSDRWGQGAKKEIIKTRGNLGLRKNWAKM